MLLNKYYFCETNVTFLVPGLIFSCVYHKYSSNSASYFASLYTFETNIEKKIKQMFLDWFLSQTHRSMSRLYL